jgi:primosomal protein N' (replication factor Y)
MLVGTQMLAKGHDFHNVTLVGVISVDIGLGLPDFRSAERTFQILTQVAGRAGRGQLPGRVLIQTYYPEHYALRYASDQDYEGFYNEEVRFRSQLSYPPFIVLASILIKNTDEDSCEAECEHRSGIHSTQRTQTKSCRILGTCSGIALEVERRISNSDISEGDEQEKVARDAGDGITPRRKERRRDAEYLYGDRSGEFDVGIVFSSRMRATA